MASRDWRPVGRVDELAPGSARVARVEGRQIALFRAEDGDGVYAVDNRCPHEGYPLVTGSVRGGTLTCEWHNWKFRLCDGVCEYGGEDVRSYPLRIRDGAIEIDVAEPPAQQVVPGLYASLADAIDEAAWGRAARTIARLRQAGEPDRAILGWAVSWAANHAPYGFDHGQAAAADYAQLLELAPGEEEVVLLQALHLLCEPHLRRPARRWPEPMDVPADPAGQLRRLIEQEQREEAEALVREAVRAGVPVAELFDWLTASATDHFLGYGHGHIYCVKAEELLEQIGHDHADPLLPSLVTDLVYATREDRLPYMRRYKREVEPHLGSLRRWADAIASPGAELDTGGLLAAVLDGELGDALGAVARELDRGVAPDRIALGLALAAAHRILRFDEAIDRDESLGQGWLDVTHTMTHADAVRESLLRRPGPEALRGLFYSARFVQHLRPLDRTDGARQIEAADIDSLFRATLEDRATLPIFVAHHVKMAACARRLDRALAADDQLASRADRGHPVAATALLVSQPMNERRIARRARVARRFVVDGQRQKTLLGY